MKKRDILKAIDAIALCAVVAVVIAVHGESAETETTYIIPEIPAVVVEREVEPVREVPVVVETAVEIEDEPCPLDVSTFYDVPLDEELQAHIINECAFYEVEPEIVFAMIERESNFQADVIGDNCNSYGLMQIQMRHHQDRMDRLGVTDLLNPYQNTTVGIDFFAELLARYDGSVEMALTAYNCGPSGAYRNYFSKGVHANAYAEKVMERCQELRLR